MTEGGDGFVEDETVEGVESCASLGFEDEKNEPTQDMSPEVVSFTASVLSNHSRLS